MGLTTQPGSNRGQDPRRGALREGVERRKGPLWLTRLCLRGRVRLALVCSSGMWTAAKLPAHQTSSVFRYDDYSCRSPMQVDSGLSRELREAQDPVHVRSHPIRALWRIYTPGRCGRTFPCRPRRSPCSSRRLSPGRSMSPCTVICIRQIHHVPACFTEFAGLTLGSNGAGSRGAKPIWKNAWAAGYHLIPPWNTYDQNPCPFFKSWVSPAFPQGPAGRWGKENELGDLAGTCGLDGIAPVCHDDAGKGRRT